MMMSLTCLSESALTSILQWSHSQAYPVFTIKGREDGFLPSPSGGHRLWNIREMLCGDAAQLAERFPSRPRALGLIGYMHILAWWSMPVVPALGRERQED